MYTLRITQLLRTFHVFGQSGTLYVKPLPPHQEDPWRASLSLRQGVVSSCYVQSESDKRILWQDMNAIQWLKTRERLIWYLDDTVYPETPPPPAQRIAPPVAQYQRSRESTMRPQLHHPMPSADLPTMIVGAHVEEDVPSLLLPRRASFSKTTLEMLSRDYKRVFALVDGYRTHTQIAMLLHYSPQYVIELLYELQKKGLVDL